MSIAGQRTLVGIAILLSLYAFWYAAHGEPKIGVAVTAMIFAWGAWLWGKSRYRRLEEIGRKRGWLPDDRQEGDL